ncbi:MAG: DNA polymerase III subunit epsilon [Cellvibrionaceae bacterium]
MRQIVLDTETTGLEPSQGHRIIEIGCVELVNRKLTGRHYHQYIQPEREVEQQAIEVHGITNEFLTDKPVFSKIVDEFMAFVDGGELVIHNAPFDIGFIDHELRLFGKKHGNKYQAIQHYCSVIDTLVMARQKHPGQKNNLDALCKRYTVDNSQRDLHGALLDAEILADVYLMMTGGQTALLLSDKDNANTDAQSQQKEVIRKLSQHIATPIIKASDDEEQAHKKKLETIEKISGGDCLWKTI